MDFLNYQNNKEITLKLGKEKIKLSDKIKIKKFGIFSKFQDRNLLITNRAIYNFKNIELKGRIKIEDLYGITYSKNSNQFVLHFNENDYDYLFLSERRDIIIRLLNALYEEQKNKELLFSVKPDADLSKYVVSLEEGKKILIYLK